MTTPTKEQAQPSEAALIEETRNNIWRLVYGGPGTLKITSINSIDAELRKFLDKSRFRQPAGEWLRTGRAISSFDKGVLTILGNAETEEMAQTIVAAHQISQGSRQPEQSEDTARLLSACRGEIAALKSYQQLRCQHDYTATFLGGDTYRCRKCRKEIDMTEDDTNEL